MEKLMAKRYTSGVTDIGGGDPMGNISMLDPRKYSVYYEDFSQGLPLTEAAETNSNYVSSQYVIVASAATTISIGTDAGTNGVGLILTNGATDTSYGRVQVQHGGFKMTSGKKFYMEASLEVTAATIATHFWACGLLYPEAAGDTSNIVDDTTFVLIADDSFVFFKDANQSSVKFRCGENDVNSDVTLLTTQVTAIWYKFAAYYDGTDIYCYLNGDLVGVTTPTAIVATPVAPCFMHLSQKAEALVSIFDYLLVVSEM
jgi:hypothetical protein